MFENYASQNTMLNTFNSYKATHTVPFKNNNLINQNIHVMNNLNNNMRQHQVVKNNMPQYQEQLQSARGRQREQQSKRQGKSGMNIIEEMLKPVDMSKTDNKDISSNYKVRNYSQKKAEKGKEQEFKITNQPYRVIMKDRIIKKDVHDINENDILVHKVNKKIDADVTMFKKELLQKEEGMEKVNDDLEIEFHIDNYDSHKKKFAYKESFIKNLEYEESTFGDNKQDYIEFYEGKQKEAEEGKKLIDEALHYVENNDIIAIEEIPSDIIETGRQ
jgi:hypothetical protein